MKIRTDIQQGSLEWLMARSGIPTASEFDNLVTPEWKIRTGQMPQSYLARKLAEWWTGGPLPGWQSIDMELGKILEDEAKPWFALTYNQEVETVGLVTTDDGRVGCSPDGIIAGCKGIEIKCPEAHTHTGYLLYSKDVPKDYAAQVQGSLWVTGFDAWIFLSYRRNFPALVMEVKPDPKAQEAIGHALETFLAGFEVGKQRLIELNGGPPKHLRKAAQPAFTSDPDDIIP